MDETYRKTLRIALKNKAISVGVIVFAFVLFLATAIIIGPHLGVEFIPSMDDGKLKLKWNCPRELI